MSAAAVAAVGLVALSVAIGIGRFAFTPILPMMQADAGLTLRAAGWMAAANYLGYLLGALFAARVRRAWAIRGGLLLIAVVTFAMGLTNFFALQLVLRFIAGIASAWVLVHVSAWSLERLAVLRRPQTNGVVFAGVGVGIAGTGLLCMLMMHVHFGSDRTWEIFGGVSTLLAAVIWPAFAGTNTHAHDGAAHVPAARVRWNRDRARLALCYAAYGFGYIIPATFLPAMARRYITNPLVFGWAWPVFGIAAASCAWAAAHWLHSVDNRKLWAICQFLMAIGVALPAVWPALTAVLIAALLVGGTLMVIVMSCLREAHVVGGEQATALIAAITAAYAVAQFIGPLVASAVVHLHHGFISALLAAAIVLLLAAAALWQSTRNATA